MNALRHRDFIESFLKANGTPVEPADVPPDLVWRTWEPCAQRLYNWHWAVHDACLWGLLEDAYRGVFVWRVPCTAPLRAAWRAIRHHLGPPGVALLAGRFVSTCFSAA
jgi:hypothetical protein